VTTPRPARIDWTLDTVRRRCTIVGDCWIWDQGVNGAGYPMGTINGQGGAMVRRFVIEVTGQAPKTARKWRAACACDNKRCVSPVCLFPSTHSAIQKRVYAEGVRIPALEREARSRAAVASFGKLTEEQVIEIRTSSGVTDAELGQRFGVARNTVRAARAGETWAHVPMLQRRSVWGVA
jgi:hypothetical protein